MRLIKEKYGVEPGEFFPKMKGKTVGCSVWKSLRKVHKFFLELIGFTVGKGNSVRFWWDSWCSKIPLKCIFPHLYRSSCQKFSTVAEVYTPRADGSYHWNLLFVRNDQQLAAMRLLSLSQMLSSQATTEEPDSLTWKY